MPFDQCHSGPRWHPRDLSWVYRSVRRNRRPEQLGQIDTDRLEAGCASQLRRKTHGHAGSTTFRPSETALSQARAIGTADHNRVGEQRQLFLRCRTERRRVVAIDVVI